MLSDKSHLCGFAGCRFHGVCAKDTYEGRYHCECPKCNEFDGNGGGTGIVCGENQSLANDAIRTVKRSYRVFLKLRTYLPWQPSGKV